MSSVWFCFLKNRASNQSPQLHRLSRNLKFCLYNVASLDMILSIKRITKALIRLRGCAGWSAPVLFANHRRQVFLRRGPYLRQFCFWTAQFVLPITCTIKCRMAKVSTLISLLLQEWFDLAIYCFIWTLLGPIRRTIFTWFQNRQNVGKV